MALRITSSSISSGITLAKKIHLVMSGWFLTINAVTTNSCANATNSNAKATKSIANGMNSIANGMNSIANGTNSTAKVTNSTANGSIAKSC